MSVILGVTMIVMTACTDDGGIGGGCDSNITSLITCAKHCLNNPADPACSSDSLEEFPELKKAIDSLRAVSKLPVLN
ncbi:MAG: hypothetical protein QM485_12340 [Flavobacteriaceae bacterium]